MDFSTLLDFAKQNDKPAKEVKCYRTAFAPPKKEPKSKSLSANIQKFLARREEEEKLKVVQANKKRSDLLALRAQDSKANKRVRAMLKSTKAANKAAIDDARDYVNTAVTMAGPSQPDEDDYGYVSQEASAFYNKLMDKYSSTPPDDPKFSKKSQTVKDLSSTKDRVRMALLKEEEEESMGHRRRKRRTKEELREKNEDDDHICYDAPERVEKEKESGNISRNSPHERVELEGRKKKRQLVPPPMDFAQLLKVAAQKQFEPIKIEKKEQKEEDDRPMTKKQKEEYLREKQYRMKKEEMSRLAAGKSKEKQQMGSLQANIGDLRTSSAPKQPSVPRIPKLNEARPTPESNSRIGGNEYEQQVKRREPQQRSGQEWNESKRNVSESKRQVDVERLMEPGRSMKSPEEKEIRSKEEAKNSYQITYKGKDAYSERKQVPSVREKKGPIEERKPSKPVLKEERRFHNPVIRDGRGHVNQPFRTDERGLSNVSSKSVMKDERKLPNQSGRSIAKEERRPAAENSKVVRTASSSIGDSRCDQLHQQVHNTLRVTSNPTRKNGDHTSKNVPSQSGNSSILKDHLTGLTNVNLVQKTKPSGNQQVTKDAKFGSSNRNSSSLGSPSNRKQKSNVANRNQNPSNSEPFKNKSTATVTSPSSCDVPVRQPLPKDRVNRNAANRSQAMSLQEPSNKGPRVPPNVKRMIEGSGEVRRLSGVNDRGVPGGRFLPPNRMRPKEMRRHPAKRRIESDDEYDSELDDFIDDGPEEGEDYSKYIKEIFGYDKSRYSQVDVEDDDECMESNFAQQMKEEFVSTKLGIMEDLEDIKQEQMEKKRKKLSMVKKMRT